MCKKRLHPVGKGETANPATPSKMGVLEAVESGLPLDELLAMRRIFALSVDDSATSTRDLAKLARRQIGISNEIDALTPDPPQEGNTDEKFDLDRL